ncbi:MAG: hypothetical protein ACI865_000819 [Flavobacteriaceae bacterium]|jgi:hypothetical protein
MKTPYIIALSVVFSISSYSVQAQRSLADSAIGTTWLGVQYAGGFTAGDLADRFGYLNNVGVFAGFKDKKNWVYGLEGNFLFGDSVALTGLFDHLTDSKGNITDINGDIATVRVLSRGLYINGVVGKILPILNPNPNSGIYVNVGVGYFLHRIRIETQDHVVPQIELDYKKGYDRLSTGANVTEFIGYAFMADQGAVNFYGGFYAQQGLTYNRRLINFDQPDTPVSTDLRIDIQFGFKLGWLIPIYQRQPKEYYFD